MDMFPGYVHCHFHQLRIEEVSIATAINCCCQRLPQRPETARSVFGEQGLHLSRTNLFPSVSVCGVPPPGKQIDHPQPWQTYKKKKL